MMGPTLAIFSTMLSTKKSSAGIAEDIGYSVFLPLAFPPVSGVHEIGVRTPHDVDNDH